MAPWLHARPAAQSASCTICAFLQASCGDPKRPGLKPLVPCLMILMMHQCRHQQPWRLDGCTAIQFQLFVNRMSTGVGPTEFTTSLPFEKTARGRIAVDDSLRMLVHPDQEHGPSTPG